MPQSTNLNKTPYYDDYNSEKNFYKVLFKPGVTVQTRELTTLQSILQNQIAALQNTYKSMANEFKQLSGVVNAPQITMQANPKNKNTEIFNILFDNLLDTFIYFPCL